MNSCNTDSIIEKLIHLLTYAGECHWVSSFNKFRMLFNNSGAEDMKILRSEILGIYGGMGSFNDLVLYNEGRPMIEENNSLDKLRKELFQILVDS